MISSETDVQSLNVVAMIAGTAGAVLAGIGAVAGFAAFAGTGNLS